MFYLFAQGSKAKEQQNDSSEEERHHLGLQEEQRLRKAKKPIKLRSSLRNLNQDQQPMQPQTGTLAERKNNPTQQTQQPSQPTTQQNPRKAPKMPLNTRPREKVERFRPTAATQYRYNNTAPTMQTSLRAQQPVQSQNQQQRRNTQQQTTPQQSRSQEQHQQQQNLRQPKKSKYMAPHTRCMVDSIYYYHLLFQRYVSAIVSAFLFVFTNFFYFKHTFQIH